MLGIRLFYSQTLVFILSIISETTKGCNSVSPRPAPMPPQPQPTPTTTEPPNFCGGVECKNGGKCVPATGLCKCIDDFRGNKCQTPPRIPIGLEKYRFEFTSTGMRITEIDAFCKSRNTRMVAFETIEEWQNFYEVFQRNLQYTGKSDPSVGIALNALPDQDGNWKWLTDESDIPKDYPPWSPGYPYPLESIQCAYAFISKNTTPDSSWGFTDCNNLIGVVVCEVDEADM